MSGLCKISQFLGADVSGSDANYNDEIAKLEKLDIQVYLGHSEKNITEDISLVVYSGAIKSDNCELQKAKELNIKCMERSQFLGIISRLFDNVIAISGTHGKTTTCAMISNILTCAKFNPTIHLGGESVNLKDNTIIGGDNYLVLEACEYRESFRYLKPNILVVTNIDADHLDYYKDIEDITRAFQRLAKKSQFVIKNECENLTIGDNYLVGKDICVVSEKFENNAYTFRVNFMGRYLDTYTLHMFGKHNVTNALFAIAVCLKLGVEKGYIKQGIEEFAGVKRRYEKIGESDGVPIIIDYAHHPTEIKNSIAGIREVYAKPLIIFQPHTYSRTLALMDEFVDVLNGNLIIYKTYPAREKEIDGGRGIDLYDNIDKKRMIMGSGEICEYIDNIQSLNKKINEFIADRRADSILILGAGDLAEKMRKYYK